VWDKEENAMPYGYIGKVLWVDPSKGEFVDREIPEEYYRKFLTGYGLAAEILFDEMKPGADPLGPENILAVMSVEILRHAFNLREGIARFKTLESGSL